MNKWHYLYNTQRWRNLRAKILKEQPLCNMCEKRGIITPSDTVDHIKAHKGDKSLFWDRNNLQTLCASCHNAAKQRKENTGYDIACDVDGVPIDEDHPWNK